jgi:hypothetical protein
MVIFLACPEFVRNGFFLREVIAPYFFYNTTTCFIAAVDGDRYPASPMFPLDPEHSAVVIPKKAKVLLVYYPDCDEFCSAVDSLARLLTTDGHCEVLEMIPIDFTF